MILLPKAGKAAVCFCLAVWTCAAPALAAGISCEVWNTRMFFARAGATDVARCLKAGADPNERGEHGVTPLHQAAARSKTPAVVKVLVDAGADIEARDKNGSTPLHWAAAASKTPAVVKVLLDAGAQVNALAKHGMTPLHIAAAASKTPAVVKALLDAGADPTGKDESGTTPFDLAKANAALKGTEVLRRLGEERFR